MVVPPPKYHVERLVPGVRLGRVGKLAGMVVIERGNEDLMVHLPADQALLTLLENGEDAFGFPPYHTLERLMHGISDVDLRSAERDILGSALAGLPATLVRDSSMGWAAHVPGILADMKRQKQRLSSRSHTVERSEALG